MAKLTIDEFSVEVPDGTNLMEVAAKAGVEIPHFCYHPGLAIVAQCRMCLVDIQGIPKVQPACNSFAKDGMVVITKNEKVKEAQRAVMEFLLINHPLDCPICDQAGECKLQDNSFGYGQGMSRYDVSKRQYPGFDRTMIGPHVVADMTRCIQCTRCIRFTQQISETGELTFQERGGKTLVWTHDGAPLANEMSACAADVCPVGALTVKEFRFRARVWYLEKTKSICPGCDVGCNISVETKDKIAYRFLPEKNLEVNDWWMCDEGRFLVEPFNRRDIRSPRRRREGASPSIAGVSSESSVASSESSVESSESIEPISFDEAIEFAAAALSGAKGNIAILAPASLPTEALWLAKRLGTRLGAKAGGVTTFVPTLPSGYTRRRIKNRGEFVTGKEMVPNGRAKMLGLADGTSLLSSESGTAPDVIIVVDGDLDAVRGSEQSVAVLRRAKTLIVLARLDSALTRAADLVIPLASHLETEGTFVNGRGRVQRFDRAFLPQDGNRPAWEILARIGRALEASEEEISSWRFLSGGSVFDALAQGEKDFAGQSWASIEDREALVTPPYEATAPVDTLARSQGAAGEPSEGKKVTGDPRA